MAGNQQSNSANRAGGQYQESLNNYCRDNGWRPPSWQAISDRRGGRTAWSAIVRVGDLPAVQARFWYDGQYVNSAREDAAQVALQRLGLLPTAAAAAAPNRGGTSTQQQPQRPQYAQSNSPQQSQTLQMQQQQQQQQQARPGQRSQPSQQSRYHGVIGN